VGSHLPVLPTLIVHSIFERTGPIFLIGPLKLKHLCIVQELVVEAEDFLIFAESSRAGSGRGSHCDFGHFDFKTVSLKER
jgi:hypothetical protein